MTIDFQERRSARMRLHSEKKSIRVLGIAESFRKTSTCSTLAGIVMRRDRIIDGMVFGNVTIEGNDSTQNILSMYRSLKRNDINCIMLDGLIVSMYNIIDGEEIRENTNVPVIAITFKDSRTRRYYTKSLSRRRQQQIRTISQTRSKI